MSREAVTGEHVEPLEEVADDKRAEQALGETDERLAENEEQAARPDEQAAEYDEQTARPDEPSAEYEEQAAGYDEQAAERDEQAARPDERTAEPDEQTGEYDDPATDPADQIADQPEDAPAVEPPAVSTSTSTSTVPLPEPLLPSASAHAFLDRWSDVQVAFIEDPHKSVTEADALLSAVAAAYQQAVEERRAQISAIRSDGTADTEDLRLALLEYRGIITMMLPVTSPPAAAA